MSDLHGPGVPVACHRIRANWTWPSNDLDSTAHGRQMVSTLDGPWPSNDRRLTGRRRLDRPTPIPNEEAHMGENLTLTAEDGHKFAAYRANPSGTPRGGIVVVQEIFGVNQHIRKVADGFAADGYVAIAPALFDRVERGFETGYGPQDIERG